MTLIVKHHSTPIEDRKEPFTHLQMFINTCELKAEQWMKEQDFDIIHYNGWTRSYFFKELQHFVLLQVTLPNHSYMIVKPWDDSNPFMSYWKKWRTAYEAKEAAYLQALRAKANASD